jgi:hypothetical protein
MTAEGFEHKWGRGGVLSFRAPITGRNGLPGSGPLLLGTVQKSPAAFRSKPAGGGANIWLVHYDTEGCKKGVKNASQNGAIFPLECEKAQYYWAFSLLVIVSITRFSFG